MELLFSRTNHSKVYRHKITVIYLAHLSVGPLGSPMDPGLIQSLHGQQVSWDLASLGLTLAGNSVSMRSPAPAGFVVFGIV